MITECELDRLPELRFVFELILQSWCSMGRSLRQLRYHAGHLLLVSIIGKYPCRRFHDFQILFLMPIDLLDSRHFLNQHSIRIPNWWSVPCFRDFRSGHLIRYQRQCRQQERPDVVECCPPRRLSSSTLLPHSTRTGAACRS